MKNLFFFFFVLMGVCSCGSHFSSRSFQILDEQNNPVPYACITKYHNVYSVLWIPPDKQEPFEVGVCDANGRFTFHHIPTGKINKMKYRAYSADGKKCSLYSVREDDISKLKNTPLFFSFEKKREPQYIIRLERDMNDALKFGPLVHDVELLSFSPQKEKTEQAKQSLRVVRNRMIDAQIKKLMEQGNQNTSQEFKTRKEACDYFQKIYGFDLMKLRQE